MSRTRDAINAHCRAHFGWPGNAEWCRLEAIGNDMILIDGQVPLGTRKNGMPKFDTRNSAKFFRAVVPSGVYHKLVETALKVTP